MKTISADLKAHLASEGTSLAQIWRITRRDGKVFRYTDHGESITFEGNVYKPQFGMVSSGIRQDRSLAVDSLESSGVLDDDEISERDLRAGLFDGATVDLYVVNYTNLGQGKMILGEGWVLGQVEIRDGSFSVELRAKASKLQQQIGEIYSQQCRAIFGDARCGFVPTIIGGEVSQTISNKSFRDQSRTETNGEVLRYGWVEFVTGPNAMIRREIKTFDALTKTFEMADPFPFVPNVGDDYTSSWGCDKSLTTCRERYNNFKNFRGEPWIPGEGSIAISRHTAKRSLWRR